MSHTQNFTATKDMDEDKNHSFQMADSSCEKSAFEFNASLQLSVSDDADDSECPLRSPSVRAYVASFEQQQHHHHRPLCRTDNVDGRHHQRSHDRPQPPCKTTTAVLKARHLRAASEDLSRSWNSTDQSESAVSGRSVAELKTALYSKLTADLQNGHRDDDINFRFADDRKEPTSCYLEHAVPVTVECDGNEVDRCPQCGTEKHTSSDIVIIPDTSVEYLPHRSSSDVDGDDQQSQPATDSIVDAVDSTGDDVGYFSLPERRSDRNRHHTARSRSQSWHLSHNCVVVVDDGVESSMTYSSDSAGSLPPGSRTSRDPHVQADVSSSTDDEHRQSVDEEAQQHVSAASPTVNRCCGRDISDSCSSRSDATVHSQQSVKSETDEDDQKSQVVPWRNSVTTAKMEPQRLSGMMIATFGRCDEALCRAVGTVGLYKTAVDYVFSVFPETDLIQQCAFDFTSSCQLDATSTGVQFLTLEAVREAARRHILQVRDEMLRVKGEMDNEQDSLRQLEARVVDVMTCKTDSRQLDKYRQYTDEKERVTRLLLLLAGRLARLDNSLVQLPPSGDSQPITAMSLTTNRDELTEKFADASTLKSDIDRRGHVISDLLASRLSADEYVDYKRLMVEKTRLRLQRQELDDWLRLAEQQLTELSTSTDDYVQDLASHC